VPFSVVDSGVPYSGRAAATTVGEALRAVGIDVDRADLVQPAAEAPLAPGVRIAIVRAQPVAITGVDLQLAGRTRATTVADLLAQWNVSLGPLDRVEPPPEATVPANGTVRVVRVREEEQKELQLVPFRTEVRYDDRLLPGTRVRTRAGVAGLMQRVIRVVFEDEAEVQRLLAGESVVRAPVDEVLVAGPAVVPALSVPGVPVAAVPPAAPPAVPSAGLPEGMGVRRVLTMDATAYDPGPASTGKRPGDPGYGITASGMRAGYGVVAIDPRVIPFYTRLYIPGYGYAIAADRGSAIVGNRIDLGFSTYGEALSWGRRPVQVYVLE
jgi:3D (Asp-Asp-Asp) domain-containing protein